MFRLSVVIIAALMAGEASAGDMQISADDWRTQVRGVDVTLKVSGKVLQSELMATVTTVIDLGDLQDKLGQIVATFPPMRRGCESYGHPYNTLGFSSAGLAARSDSAVLVLTGIAEAWVCIQNTVPNSKVQMRNRDIGLGLKVQVPEVVTVPGAPVETKIAAQSFTASLPFALETSEISVNLIPGQPSISLDGYFTEGAMVIRNTLQELASAALSDVINWSEVRRCLPVQLNLRDLKIQTARFTEAGNFAVEIVASGRLNDGMARQPLSFNCPGE